MLARLVLSTSRPAATLDVPGAYPTVQDAVDPTGDDDDATAYPGATEIVGDGIDQDCDGTELCYVDGDDDGFRTSDTAPSNDADCDDPGEAQAAAPDGDCEDADPQTYPGARDDTIDGVDQDCDDTEPCFLDTDLDGFGAGAPASGPVGCTLPGYSGTDDDCDDTDVDTFPSAPERCDERDNDCDTLVDEDVVYLPWWPDRDGDGFGDGASSPTVDCFAPPDHVGNDLDCDDGESLVSPGVPEIACDGLDNDCDPSTPDCATETDTDNDVDTDTETDVDTDTDVPGPGKDAEGVDASGLSVTCGCDASPTHPALLLLRSRR